MDDESFQSFFTLQEMECFQMRLVDFFFAAPDFQRVQRNLLRLGLELQPPLRLMLHGLHRFQPDHVMNQERLLLGVNLRIQKQKRDLRILFAFECRIIRTGSRPIR